jgi:hypothetical protein
MGRYIDLTGEQFGRLRVLGREGMNKHRQLTWMCECECGNRKVVLGVCLRRGDVQSCGCLHKEVTASINKTHGKTRTPIYAIWRGMMQRCFDKNYHAYNRYGGRGVSVCERWQSFENFYADMGERPDGMSLERLDNDGDYSPENVAWADAKSQANNRRSNVVLEYKGEKKTMQQWCDELGLNIGTVWSRIKVHGYSVEKALTPGWRGRNVLV